MQSQKEVLENSVSSIRISHKAKSKLAKIGARMTLRDGRMRSMEEIIDKLVEFYEEKHNEEKE